MYAPKLLILVVFAVTAVRSDYIRSIEVRTADCDDCGMSNTFGALRMQVIESKHIYLLEKVRWNCLHDFYPIYIFVTFNRYVILTKHVVIPEN